MERTSKVSEYFWKLKEETCIIPWDEELRDEIKTVIKEESKVNIKSDDEEINLRNGKDSRGSIKSLDKNKKKERRKNPFTQSITILKKQLKTKKMQN